MKKEIKDERIIQETRKQNNLGFSILYFGLLFALLYRQFIIKSPISDYLDLAILFFGINLIMQYFSSRKNEDILKE